MNENSPRSTASGPAVICATTASMVGRTFHTSEVTTFSGASDCWSTIMPITGRSASSAASMTPGPLGEQDVGAGAICASAACLAAAGSKKELMNETLTVASGLVSLTPAMKPLTIRLTSGIGIAATTPIMPDLVSPPASMPARYAGSCSQLSNTLKFGAWAFSPEPKAKTMSG